MVLGTIRLMVLYSSGFGGVGVQEGLVPPYATLLDTPLKDGRTSEMNMRPAGQTDDFMFCF